MFSAAMAKLPIAYLGIPEERRAEGQARRKQIKRQHHGVWDAKLRRKTVIH